MGFLEYHARVLGCIFAHHFSALSYVQTYREFKGLNLPQIATEVSELWSRENVFERSISERDENNPFVFYEGPPSANGMPGIHHVMARAIKDIFCRYQTLNGRRVNRKAGWDTRATH